MSPPSSRYAHQPLPHRELASFRFIKIRPPGLGYFKTDIVGPSSRFGCLLFSYPLVRGWRPSSVTPLHGGPRHTPPQHHQHIAGRYWGGSAHYAEPTAQSAPAPPSFRRQERGRHATPHAHPPAHPPTRPRHSACGSYAGWFSPTPEPGSYSRIRRSGRRRCACVPVSPRDCPAARSIRHPHAATLHATDRTPLVSLSTNNPVPTSIGYPAPRKHSAHHGAYVYPPTPRMHSAHHGAYVYPPHTP